MSAATTQHDPTRSNGRDLIRQVTSEPDDVAREYVAYLKQRRSTLWERLFAYLYPVKSGRATRKK